MKIDLDCLYAAQPKTTRGYPCHLSCDNSSKYLTYGNGSNVFVLNLEHPSDCTVFSNHISKVQSVRCCVGSNNRSVIASADAKGNLHIYEFVDADNQQPTSEQQPMDRCKEHKSTFQEMFSLLRGKQFKQISELHPPLVNVNDIAMSSDFQRIAVGGRGWEKFGHVLTSDSGNSLGDIMGMSREVRTLDFRPSKPMRVVFGSDDGTICFFNGPPFKFARKLDDISSKSINCLRFSYNGQLVALASSDGQVTILNGDNGDKITSLGSPVAHSRSVMGVSWSPNSELLSSVGTDGVVCIWNIENPHVPSFIYRFNTDDQFALQSQQLGCLWMDNWIVSLSINGSLSVFDSGNLFLRKTIKGHQNAISALAFSDGYIISGDVDGVIMIRNDLNTITNTLECHKNKVLSIAVANKWTLSCGLDNRIVFFNVSQGKVISDIQLSDQPVGCATNDQGISIVTCRFSLLKFEGTVQIESHRVPGEIRCMSITSDFSKLVCGTEDKRLLIYNANELDVPFNITCLINCPSLLAHSPNSKYLAVATDQSNSILCLDCSSYESVEKGYWTYHAAQITSFSWSPNGRYLASSSVDTHLTLHDTNEFSKVVQHRNAHDRSPVLATCWPWDNVLLTSGSDSCIRKWKVTTN